MSEDLSRRQGTIRASLESRDTEDLLEIWHLHDTDEWSDVAFDVLEDILRERLGEVPQPDPELVRSKNNPQDDDAALPDFLHNTDRVFSMSYWARILSWVLLLLFLGNAGIAIANSVGSISKASDLLFLYGPLVTTTIGVAYFVILQAVSEGLLALVDIAIDVNEGQTSQHLGS